MYVSGMNFHPLLYLVVVVLSVFSSKVCSQATGGSSAASNIGNSLETRSSPDADNALFGHWYSGVIDVSTVMKMYKFKYNFQLNMTQTMRVHTNTSGTSSSSDPVVFVIRQQKGIMSWQLPMKVGKNSYNIAAKNVCPLKNYPDVSKSSEGFQDVYIDIATQSKTAVQFGLMLNWAPQYLLQDVPITFETSPSEPKYFEYTFPPGHDMIFVEMHSSDSLCMTMSVQNKMCPIYDSNVNVQYTGHFQTVLKKSGMTIKKSMFPNGFVIIFIVKDSDVDCFTGNSNIDSSGLAATPNLVNRIKTVTVSVKERITKSQYDQATFGALGIFLIFYVFSMVISTVYAIREWKNPSERNLLEPRELSRLSSPAESNLDSNHYGSITDGNVVRSLNIPPSPHSLASSSITTDTDQSFVEPDVDMLDDAESEKDIFRTKTFLFVADLARKDTKKLRKKSRMYHWNLLTIAVFYALPVAQLVYTYQSVVTGTGNEDLCYYNFLCAYPQSKLTDFNHVYSNIGFILLGFLFLGLVWRKDLIYRKAIAMNDRLEKFYGIPSHFGLFYSMGIALMMEGVLSGCYHVCPNYANFQFDTTYMYLISWLCMLKIYQTRHPDIIPNAHSVYVVFACIIIVSVMGVLFGTVLFWIMYAIIHVLSSLVLSAQIYYMGRWKMNFGIFKRMYLTLKNDLYTHFTQPMYMDRFILLTIGNLINWSFMLYGLIKQPKDFGSFLLTIFIMNLLLYTAFYIVMKIRHKEKILPLPIIYIVLSCITWGAAVYFFMQNDTSWKLTPAESRDLNRPCLIMNFYDDHDIWHFLSSSALFFSFMILLTLDDDLIYTPRDKIPVF